MKTILRGARKRHAHLEPEVGSGGNEGGCLRRPLRPLPAFVAAAGSGQVAQRLMDCSYSALIQRELLCRSAPRSLSD